MTLFRNVFSVLVIAFISAGCSSEKETLGEIRSLPSSDVINSVNAYSSSVKTFSADGSISITSPRITQTAGFELEVKRPDSVKLVLEGPFGITVARALLTKERFIAYSIFQNSVYEGNTETKTGLLAMIDIPPSIVVDVLAGFRRFSPGETLPDSFSASGGLYRMQFLSEKTVKKYIVNAVSNRIVGVETMKRNDGKLLWRETYEYEHSDSTWNPLSVTIVVPDKETTVEIMYNDISINPVLQPFTIAYPSDAHRITIE